jgi:hypothetical protein
MDKLFDDELWKTELYVEHVVMQPIRLEWA